MNKQNINFQKVLKDVISGLDTITDGGVPDSLISLIKKLGDSLQINSLINIREDSDFIDYEKVSYDWGGQFLQVLIEGIRNKKVLEIYYQPFYEDKPYFIRVHAYLLKEYRSRWYLIGLNETKRELRTYGLDRIWDVKETDVPYIEKEFNTKEYFKNTVGIISPAGEPPKIRIEVSKPQAQYLITQPIHPSQSIESEDSDSIIFNYRVHPTYEFKALLLGLGGELKVLDPKSLKNAIIKELEFALKKYS